jgi:hypothetical protein
MNQDEQAVRVVWEHCGLLPTNCDGSAPDLSTALLDRGAEGLRERFPWVQCWWGPYTRRWWAYLPGAGLGRLVEAGGPKQLADEILRALGQSWG